MKLMTFKWEGNSYGISLDKLNSANNSIWNKKKIHPFFQEFKIPKKTISLALKSGYFFPTLRSSNACLIMINSSSCPPLSA